MGADFTQVATFDGAAATAVARVAVQATAAANRPLKMNRVFDLYSTSYPLKVVLDELNGVHSKSRRGPHRSAHAQS